MNKFPFTSKLATLYGLTSKKYSQELKILEIAEKEVRLHDIYKIAYAFYVAAKGKAYSVSVVRELVMGVTGLWYANALGLKTTQDMISAQLDEMLENDSQLRSIERFFPEYFAKLQKAHILKNYQGTFETFLTNYSQSISLISRVLLTLLQIAGWNEQDLEALVVEAGRIMDTSTFRRSLEENIVRLEKNDSKHIDRNILYILNNAVKERHMLATGISVETYSVSTLTKMQTQELLTLANRYDIFKHLRQNCAAILSRWDEVSDGIIDVFADYQRSSLRVTYLSLFIKRFTKYIQS